MNQQLIPGGVTAAGMAGKLSYDVQALNQLRARSRTDEQGSIKAVAQQFESLFTSMMLRSMRAAVPDSGLTGSSETRMFQGMFDDQLAQNLSGLRGLGLPGWWSANSVAGRPNPPDCPGPRSLNPAAAAPCCFICNSGTCRKRSRGAFPGRSGKRRLPILLQE